MSDLIAATEVDLVAVEAHLYFVKDSPSEHFLGQAPTFPLSDV